MPTPDLISPEQLARLWAVLTDPDPDAIARPLNPAGLGWWLLPDWCCY